MGQTKSVMIFLRCHSLALVFFLQIAAQQTSSLIQTVLITGHAVTKLKQTDISEIFKQFELAVYVNKSGRSISFEGMTDLWSFH